MHCTPCVQANCDRIKCCVGRHAACELWGCWKLSTTSWKILLARHLRLLCPVIFLPFLIWTSLGHYVMPHGSNFLRHRAHFYHLETSIWRTHAWKTARVGLPSLSNWSSVFQQWVSFVEQKSTTDLSQLMRAGVPTGPNPVTSILLPSNSTSPLSRLLWSNLSFSCFWHEWRVSCSSQSEPSTKAPTF